MTADMQGKADYSIAESHGVTVDEHRYDAVLDASTSIIVIEMPFLRVRAEMEKLRTAMEKASSEYDQERELYAGLPEELKRFEAMLSSTVDLFTVKDKRKDRTLAEWLGGLMGLYNTVKVRQIETKEDSTRDALKTALVHLNAMDLNEKEEEKSIGEVIDKLEDTRKLMFRGSRARQAKNSLHKVRELVQAFIKVGDTACSGEQGGPSAIQPGPHAGGMEQAAGGAGEGRKENSCKTLSEYLTAACQFLGRRGHAARCSRSSDTEDVSDGICGLRGQDPVSAGGGQDGLPENGRGHAAGSPGDGDDRAHRGHGAMH
jgi:hypothetical protein